MTESAIASNRFGLGARSGAVARGDPRGAIKAQLREFQPRPDAISTAPTRSEVVANLVEFLEEKRAMGGRKAKAEAADAAAPDEKTRAGPIRSWLAVMRSAISTRRPISSSPARAS